ncbi:hypothetical protein [Streptomyces sp. TRM68367]|uniref:hypothetical protein n=1 Tax=Streptomyces sp. TRM68367 TaxID=2758415 RepID=UPI002934C5EA|nr:hypothetical protein [Streptomyces sp. TRM68367]
MTCGGCLVSLVGTLTAVFAWASSARTERHMGGGFEGEGTDYSVLCTELPLVVVGGAVVPVLGWLLVAYLVGWLRRT